LVSARCRVLGCLHPSGVLGTHMGREADPALRGIANEYFVSPFFSARRANLRRSATTYDAISLRPQWFLLPLLVPLPLLGRRGMRPDPRRRCQLAGHTIASARAQADRIKVVVTGLEGEGFVERSLLRGPQRAASTRVQQPRIHNDNSKETMVDSNRPLLGVVLTFEH
jgi:hypothetical protein